VVDVPDWEYDHAVNAGWAVHADPPEPEKSPEPDPEPAASVLEVNEAGHPTGNLVPEDGVPEPADAEVPEPPRPADPKQAWVDYAAGQGMDPETAAAMSKADLMSRYGGRL
jgi:hypothetical protein